MNVFFVLLCFASSVIGGSLGVMLLAKVAGLVIRLKMLIMHQFRDDPTCPNCGASIGLANLCVTKTTALEVPRLVVGDRPDE